MTMTTITSNAPPATGTLTRILRGIGEWWRGATGGNEIDAASHAAQLRLALGAGTALIGIFWGTVIAVAGVNSLYLCLAVVASVFILFDFRIGVVLLILLLPVSRGALFPHAMMGMTGLNPLNLLFVATLGSYALQALSGGGWRRFVPQPLVWLYVVPIVIAGLIGSSHVGEIAQAFYLMDMDFLQFQNPAGYLRETVFKPLMLVVFALLVGAAAGKSERPEKFLVPAIVSIWAMSLLVIVYVLWSGAGLGRLAGADSREFLSALGLHANDLGRLYAVAYALLLFTWARAKEPGLRFALLASMGIVVLALVLTFSRSAFFGFIVVNALFILWNMSARGLLLVAALAVGALLMPAAVYERAAEGFGAGLDAISAGRVRGLWLPLLPEVLKSPIWGGGHMSILWSEPMRMAGGSSVLLVTHPHSAYLQALLDMGIVGLLLICAYYLHAWRGFRALAANAALSATMRGFYQGAAAGLVSLLIMGVADGALTPRAEQVFLWFAIGMLYGQWRVSPGTARGR